MRRVLLLGDFSGVHISLRNGLRDLGVNARVLSSGDGYKSMERDLDFAIPQGLSRTKRYIALLQCLQKNHLELRNNDVVQFVSPFFFQNASLNDFFFKFFLKYTNTKLYYLACSSDQGFFFSKKQGILKDLLYDPISAVEKDFEHNREYVESKYNNGLFNREKTIVLETNGIIAPSFDYFNYTSSLYKNHPIKFIPFPLDLKNLPFHENKLEGKLIFLHGMHRNRYHFKGSFFISEAFKILKQKYPNDVEVRIIDSLPYNEYIGELLKCNVFVDQTDAYDVGMAALQALALGRITLSGSEPEVNKFYLGRENTIINIRPNVEHIVKQCEKLLECRSFVKECSYKGRLYVEENHSHVKVAAEYVKHWGLWEGEME
jgi:hypothetical protein